MWSFFPFLSDFSENLLLTWEPAMAILQDHSNMPGHLLNPWLVPLRDVNGDRNLEGAVGNLSIKFQNNFAVAVLLYCSLWGYLPVFRSLGHRLSLKQNALYMHLSTGFLCAKRYLMKMLFAHVCRAGEFADAHRVYHKHQCLCMK